MLIHYTLFRTFKKFILLFGVFITFTYAADLLEKDSNERQLFIDFMTKFKRYNPDTDDCYLDPESSYHLQRISIYSTIIYVVPWIISAFSNLKELRFVDCEIRDLPVGIGNLQALKTCYLSENKLLYLRREFGNLTNLRELYLRDNQLSSLPQTFKKLTNLKSLSLASNQFKAFPTQIVALTNLKNLNIDSNKKPFAAFPSQLFSLTMLTKLSFNNNDIRFFPPEIGQLTNLTELFCRHNPFEHLSLSILRLNKLRMINLSETNIKFPIIIPGDYFGKIIRGSNWGQYFHGIKYLLAYYRQKEIVYKYINYIYYTNHDSFPLYPCCFPRECVDLIFYQLYLRTQSEF